MDRNLGALKNEDDAEGEARGLYYQYGRNTPLPRGSGWVNAVTVLPTFTANGVSASSNLRPKLAIQSSIQSPLKYISTNYPLWTENSYLWVTRVGKHKTAYDPCPEGWRVPKQATLIPENASPWNKITTSGFINPGIVAPWTYGFYHIHAGFFPYAGLFNGQTGVVEQSNAAGYYWTAWQGTSGSGAGMSFYRTNSPLLSLTMPLDMYHGRSIRCVVDEDYIRSTGGGLFGGGGGNMGGGGGI
jgi:hypothetical protein